MKAAASQLLGVVMSATDYRDAKTLQTLHLEHILTAVYQQFEGTGDPFQKTGLYKQGEIDFSGALFEDCCISHSSSLKSCLFQYVNLGSGTG